MSKPRSLATKKLKFETIRFSKKKTAERLVREWRREADLLLIKDLVKWLKLSALKVVGTLRTVVSELHLRRVFCWFKNFKWQWYHVVIALLLGILISGGRTHAIPETGNHAPTFKKIPKLAVKKLHQAKAVHKTFPSQTVARSAPVASNGASGNCGDNAYAHYIYEHESGCRTNAINPQGCAGIGQACPGSKLPCSLSDYACQNRYFTAYANSAYGGWAGAYNHWLAFHWW